jgi:probable HAF family extracellular repeat protein
MLASSLAVTPVSPGDSTPKYRLVDLSTEIGASWGNATGINDFGQVIGYSPSGFVIWHPAGDDWVATDLQIDIWMCHPEYLSAINNAGLVMGSVVCDFAVRYTLLWNTDGVGDVLCQGIGRDMNDQGHVAGSEPYAWLWESDAVQIIDPMAHAWGINNRSEVVGISSEDRAALWIRDTEGVWQMTDLGILGNANDINDHGQIAGAFSITPGISHPFLWEDGRMLDLGILPGFTASDAMDLNESGQVVGYAANADWTAWRGYLWQDGTMWDLNDVVVSGPSLAIRGALGINESGQIVGWGKTQSGDFHAILLDPVALGDVDADGDIDGSDFYELLASWGACPECYKCPADVDGNCLVGINDLLVLLGNWGP